METARFVLYIEVLDMVQAGQAFAIGLLKI